MSRILARGLALAGACLAIVATPAQATDLPPTIVKAFGAAEIPLDRSTSLTFTLGAPRTNVFDNTTVRFTDGLPGGLVVSTPSALANTCGGTATAVAGSSTVSLSNADLAPGTACTVSVNVTGIQQGIQQNSVDVLSDQGTSAVSSAQVTVDPPDTISKAFGAAAIPLGGSTSLTFTLGNTDTSNQLSGIGFTDTLPAGLVVSTPSGLSNPSCGGTATAVAGSSTISLSQGSLAANRVCTVSVNVTGVGASVWDNTVTVRSDAGTGNTSHASLTVVAPPALQAEF